MTRTTQKQKFSDEKYWYKRLEVFEMGVAYIESRKRSVHKHHAPDNFHQIHIWDFG